MQSEHQNFSQPLAGYCNVPPSLRIAALCELILRQQAIGNSLAAQWLGLCPCSTMAQVQSLIRGLSCAARPKYDYSIAKYKVKECLNKKISNILLSRGGNKQGIVHIVACHLCAKNRE